MRPAAHQSGGPAQLGLGNDSWGEGRPRVRRFGRGRRRRLRRFGRRLQWKSDANQTSPSVIGRVVRADALTVGQVRDRDIPEQRQPRAKRHLQPAARPQDEIVEVAARQKRASQEQQEPGRQPRVRPHRPRRKRNEAYRELAAGAARHSIPTPIAPASIPTTSLIPTKPRASTETAARARQSSCPRASRASRAARTNPIREDARNGGIVALIATLGRPTDLAAVGGASRMI